MSIGRRFIDMARAELNELLDRAAERTRREGDGAPDPDAELRNLEDELRSPPRSTGRPRPVANARDLSDDELMAEIECRYRERHGSPPESEPRGRASAGAGRASSSDDIRRAYAVLEVPPGSDFATVKKAYRALMRKYHPDRHTGSAEKQRAAHELALKITQAYERLEKHLGA